LKGRSTPITSGAAGRCRRPALGLPQTRPKSKEDPRLRPLEGSVAGSGSECFESVRPVRCFSRRRTSRAIASLGITRGKFFFLYWRGPAPAPGWEESSLHDHSGSGMGGGPGEKIRPHVFRREEATRGPRAPAECQPPSALRRTHDTTRASDQGDARRRVPTLTRRTTWLVGRIHGRTVQARRLATHHQAQARKPTAGWYRAGVTEGPIVGRLSRQGGGPGIQRPQAVPAGGVPWAHTAPLRRSPTGREGISPAGHGDISWRILKSPENARSMRVRRWSASKVPRPDPPEGARDFATTIRGAVQPAR